MTGHAPDRARLDATFAWPPFFQADDGQSSPDDADATRLPADLLDVFYLRRDLDATPVMVAVASCLGGDLAVFGGEELDRLRTDEPALSGQLQAVRVAQRDDFRVVTARELFLSTLDTTGHTSTAAGYNDPVDLRGTMQARLANEGGRIEITPLHHPGRATVGRLDLLHGYRLAGTRAFESPGRGGGRVFPLLAPLAPIDEIEQGNGLTLYYPIPDAEVSRKVDNTFLVLAIVHGVLVRVQQDMARSSTPHPLANLALPVPNRLQVEEELVSEGYEIRGDVAVKQSDSGNGDRSGLQRFLNALGLEPAATRVILPLQAAPDHYERLIDQLLRAVASTEDERMLSALTDRVEPRSGSTAHRMQPSPPGPTPQPQLRPVATPVRSRRPAPPSTARRRDYSSDFATPEPAQPASSTGSWASDFDPSPASPEAASSGDDFSRDFDDRPDTRQRGRSKHASDFSDGVGSPRDSGTSTPAGST